MDIQNQKNNSFIKLYNKSYRLSAAIFSIANLIDDREELRTKIKKLSLDIVSLSVRLKDTPFFDAKKIISEIEKNSLELMSMLDISAITGMVSKMNAKIIKDEFESFINEITDFASGLDVSKNIGVEELIKERGEEIEFFQNKQINERNLLPKKNEFNSETKGVVSSQLKNGNGQTRKLTRKVNIYEFIKRHNNVTIKDIVPHIVGCSEKTIQRELVDLINEGKITKHGERRWTRYSVI